MKRRSAHSPGCVGRAGPPTSLRGDLSPPGPLPWPTARDGLLPRGERSFRPLCWRSKRGCSLPGLTASAGAPPARPPASLPGPRADARGGESGVSPRKGPERSCRCPAWRPSPRPRPSANGTEALSTPGGLSQGRGSSRPGTLRARCPLALAHSGGWPASPRESAKGTEATCYSRLPFPPRPPAPPPLPAGAA